MTNKTKTNEILVGFTLFSSSYYILSVNPEILNDNGEGVPYSLALTGTFLLVIFGNLRGAFVTKTGLIIAPAVGISSFFSNYVNTAGIEWKQGFISCLIAGIAILITSKYSALRTKVINQLPTPIKVGIQAAIGTLLFEAGLKLVIKGIESRMNNGFIILLMLLGVGIIFLFTFLRTTGRKGVFYDIRIEHFLSVTILTGILHFFNYVIPFIRIDDYFGSFPTNYELQTIIPYMSGEWESVNFFTSFLEVIVLSAIIWFLLLTDIPGTPHEVLPKDFIEENPEVIKKGFVNDSWFALLAPMLGTSPSIFYSENLILKDSKEYGARVGYTVAILFLACFLISIGLSFFMKNVIVITDVIPPLAVAPVLMYIGVFVVADSFLIEDKTEKGLAHTPSYYFPAAIAVTLTPVIGLEFSFPISIISHWITAKETNSTFRSVAWGSIAIVIIYIVLMVSNEF